MCKNIKISNPLKEGCRLGPVISGGQVNCNFQFLCPRAVKTTHYNLFAIIYRVVTFAFGL